MANKSSLNTPAAHGSAEHFQCLQTGIIDRAQLEMLAKSSVLSNCCISRLGKACGQGARACQKTGQGYFAINMLYIVYYPALRATSGLQQCLWNPSKTKISLQVLTHPEVTLPPELVSSLLSPTQREQGQLHFSGCPWEAQGEAGVLTLDEIPFSDVDQSLTFFPEEPSGRLS